MPTQPPPPSFVMMFLPLLLPLGALALIVAVWLVARPRKLRVGERVSVWAGADRVPATVVGGTGSTVWVRYDTGTEGEVPRAAVKPQA